MDRANFGDDGTGSISGRLRFRRLRGDPEVFALTQAIADERGVSLTALLRRSRGPCRAAAARQLSIYLAHVLLGRPQDVIAELFCRDRTTIAHACHRVEDHRDESALEAEIVRIEQRCRSRRRPAAELRHAA